VAIVELQRSPERVPQPAPTPSHLAPAPLRRPAGAPQHREPTRRWRFEVAFLVAVVAIEAASLSMAFQHGGWPAAHEGLAFKFRTEVYAAHMRHGDLFPLWSSGDAFGLGTPLPLFYHKAFYLVSGPLLLLFGNVKAAVVGAIAVFMTIGAYGIRFSIRRFSTERVLLVVAPQAFLLSNYAFTNWLVRGAMAEFAAMMIVPWLLWWLLTLLIDRRFSYAIVPILFTLYLAHSAIALVASVPLALGIGAFFVTEPRRRHELIWRGVLAAAALAALVVPMLLMMRTFLIDYNPGRITEGTFTPTRQFHPLLSYFLPHGFVWLRDPASLTVQIDVALWVGAAAFLVWLVARRPDVDRRLVGVLLGSTAVFLFLQTHAATFVYEHVRPLDFLQFPWRLLAYITPLLLVIVCYGFAQVYRSRRSEMGDALVVAWLAAFVVLTPLLHRFDYPFVSAKRLEAATPANDHGGFGGNELGIGEYLPIVVKDGARLTGQQTVALYTDKLAGQRAPQVLSGGPCTFQRDAAAFEALQESLRAHCDAPATVALPYSYSAYTVVRDVTDHGRSLPVLRRPDDPRQVVLLEAGSRALRVEFPTLGRLIASWF
jgi:hypothetical protein